MVYITNTYNIHIFMGKIVVVAIAKEHRALARKSFY